MNKGILNAPSSAILFGSMPLAKLLTESVNGGAAFHSRTFCS
jgi:hypothetical protein